MLQDGMKTDIYCMEPWKSMQSTMQQSSDTLSAAAVTNTQQGFSQGCHVS